MSLNELPRLRSVVQPLEYVLGQGVAFTLTLSASQTTAGYPMVYWRLDFEFTSSMKEGEASTFAEAITDASVHVRRREVR